MEMSDSMKRMHRNICACGQRGLWIHGRTELSTAKALERRGLIAIKRVPGRLGDFASSLMPVMAYVVKHDMENCNCHECRTFRWRERLNNPQTEVVGMEAIYNSSYTVKIVEDCGWDENGERSVTIRSEDTKTFLQAHINQLKPPVL